MQCSGPVFQVSSMLKPIVKLQDLFVGSNSFLQVVDDTN